MHTLCIVSINFMHTMCRLCETFDLGGAYTVASNELSRCSLLTTTCEKPARMVWGQRGPFCDCWFWGRWCTTLQMTPPNPQNDGSIGRSWGTAKGATRSPRRM